MNKLISRNPVLRFKEGKKILKFQNAGVISYKGRDGIDYEAFSGPRGWYYRKKGTLDILNMPKNYVTTTGIRFYDANGNMIKNPSSNLNNGSSPRDYSFMTKGTLSSESTEDKKQRESYFNSQKEKLGFASTLFGTLGDDLTKRLIEAMAEPVATKGSDKTSFKSAFNKARQSGLQEFVWNGGRYNTKDKGEEDFIFQNGKWVAPQPAVETPVVPQIQLPTAPSSIYSLINPVEKDLKAPLSVPTVPQTYNRAQVREFLRNKGLNPYSFTGDQRRAVRMILNGQGTDEDKALVQSMGIFNNNPKVVPLTISELDLNTQKKVMDLTKNMVTDRKWWDASLSPTVDILNLLGQLKLASLSYKQGGMLPSRNIVERFKKKFLVSGPVTTLKTGGNIPIYKRGGINNSAKGKKVQAFQRQLNKILKTKIKVDGYWGKNTQAAYEAVKKLGFINQNGELVKTLPEINIQARPQYAGIITSSNSSNSSKTYKPWRPTEEVGVVGACGTENCSEWANKSLKRHKDFKGRFLYANDEVGGDAWTRLSAGKHAKMVYSGYNGMDYNPNNYDYNLATQRNWQAAQNLYDNFDSKTLDKNKTYLVNMYYNGSPQTENAWRNATNGTTGTHTGNLYWNPETNSWRVAHNIHNKLYDDDFIKVQGVRKGKHQYGVTAIAEAPMTDYTRSDWNEAHPIKAAINRIHDFGMWKEGGKLKKKLIKALYGTELPEVTVTSINVNKHAGSPQHRKFIRALNSNRNEFMKKYKLSDLEYADLSKFALNLSGAESSNGYDRNVFKRTYIYPDWMIHLGKLWRRGKDSANSRGLTQIKYDDDIKNPDLLKYYIDLGITGRNIKYDPSSMARATLGRTLWILDLLKKQYGDLSIHYADGTEMPQEIAQYLYWNRGKVTDRANGNPETGSTVGAANLIKYYNSKKNI